MTMRSEPQPDIERSEFGIDRGLDVVGVENRIIRKALNDAPRL
jgi:hypothetical protein